ncbi:ABC-2 transporter permease [Bacillus rubiinfantis]|uniref:ABC-2 transporter permease n=1 Tax=Bacillus rubiinfantis TaxID=1499680 RepID=UPI0005A8CF49|nr:ABC-2 transporter permease [Bacillus rubiinfantis]
MYSLMLKEFLLLRKMLLLITGFIILFHILENPPVLAFSLAGFMFVSSSGSFESRSNSHIMLNSLPLNRSTIVTAKYIGAVIFGVFAIVIASLCQAFFYFILHTYQQPLPDVRQLLFGMISILLFTAIYYPILYKFGEKYTRIIFMIVLLGFILLGQILMYVLKNQVVAIQDFISQFSANGLIMAGSAVTIVLLLASWLLTVKIYQAKDF